jgi:hypothetical protein
MSHGDRACGLVVKLVRSLCIHRDVCETGDEVRE